MKDKGRDYGFLVWGLALFMAFGFGAAAQDPQFTVRFANPVFDCDTLEYWVDVEFQSNESNLELDGMNVRFFYEDGVLLFKELDDFLGGHKELGATVTVGSVGSGEMLFGFPVDSRAAYVQGAIEGAAENLNPIHIVNSTTEWTKLYSVGFTVVDPAAVTGEEFFCPSIIWDLQENPANGGFLPGSAGVVMTAVLARDGDGNISERTSVDEQVEQFNWDYDGVPGLPHGAPDPIDCLDTRCEAELVITKTAILIGGGTPDPFIYSAVGDVITYEITVENTGQLTISNIIVEDPLTGMYEIIPSLAPGESVDPPFETFYTITQGDLNVGQVDNVLVIDPGVTGVNPYSVPVPPEALDDTAANETVYALQGAAIIISDLTVTPQIYTGFDVGVLLEFSMTVANIGNVTLTAVTLEVFPGVVIDVGGPIDLAPGESIVFTAAHTITDDDITNESFSYTATVNGNYTDPVSGPQIATAQDSVAASMAVALEVYVYLEGVANTLPMRTDLNQYYDDDLFVYLLPGQTYWDFALGERFYNPPGQPYNMPPWNYAGNEGDGFDSGDNPDPLVAHAGYAPTVVDWVLVSVRATPDGAPLCQAAALLHNDGAIEFIDKEFQFCALDRANPYYIVVEHRNHLMVMSDAAIFIAAGKLTYDFRDKQSYVDDPFGFGYVGQKDIGVGNFAMLGGNGMQVGVAADTDINMEDMLFLYTAIGDAVRFYQIADYSMNGDTNFNDRTLWEANVGKFTSVPSGN